MKWMCTWNIQVKLKLLRTYPFFHQFTYNWQNWRGCLLHYHTAALCERNKMHRVNSDVWLSFSYLLYLTSILRPTKCTKWHFLCERQNRSKCNDGEIIPSIRQDAPMIHINHLLLMRTKKYAKAFNCFPQILPLSQEIWRVNKTILGSWT